MKCSSYEHFVKEYEQALHTTKQQTDPLAIQQFATLLGEMISDNDLYYQRYSRQKESNDSLASTK